MSANFEQPKMSNNNNSNDNSRANRSSNRNQNSITRWQWTSRSNSWKNQKNTVFALPKELGNHVFIMGPNAPTEHHKTKLAIINHITKEMTNAKEIKWDPKHEEECDCSMEAPKPKDKEGKLISIDITTAEGLQLKLEIEQHLKNKQTCKFNKRPQLVDASLGNAPKQWRTNWRPEKTGASLKTTWWELSRPSRR